jgi:hypothetical protein
MNGKTTSREMGSAGQIKLAGCVYELETGRVRFLGDVNTTK